MTSTQIQLRLGHEEARVKEQWGWNWNSVKRVLEELFQQGVVSAAGRTPQFERRYPLTSRVMPDPVHALTAVDPAEAILHLAERAAAALGVGTVRCISDYFRIPRTSTKAAVDTLVQRGTLSPVSIEGWDRAAYRHVAAVLPRRASGKALLSPFDSLVFERGRLHSLFGFHYRIEIYTPAPARKYGYYVLPFLLGDRIVARLDLKADRISRRLLVRGTHGEPDAPPDIAVELASELVTMAAWLDLDDVVVEANGNLASALNAAITSA